MLNLLLITNSPSEARVWDSAGVDYVFIDLEVLGKDKRQGHLNTVISRHTLQDISAVRPSVESGKLLVRVNPLFSDSSVEVEEVIARGADVIMLPMFHGADEVKRIRDIVNGRCELYPLIETPGALLDIDNLCAVDGVTGYHVGLNDLHLAYGYKFMFEVMLRSDFKYAIDVLRNHDLPFGIGGVARLGGGDLPSELILSEHKRLGSTRVILSRSFKQDVKAAEAEAEIVKIKNYFANIKEEDFFRNMEDFNKAVIEISGREYA